MGGVRVGGTFGRAGAPPVWPAPGGAVTGHLPARSKAPPTRTPGRPPRLEGFDLIAPWPCPSITVPRDVRPKASVTDVHLREQKLRISTPSTYEPGIRSFQGRHPSRRNPTSEASDIAPHRVRSDIGSFRHRSPSRPKRHRKLQTSLPVASEATSEASDIASRRVRSDLGSFRHRCPSRRSKRAPMPVPRRSAPLDLGTGRTAVH